MQPAAPIPQPVNDSTPSRRIHLMIVSGSLAGGGAERFVSTLLQRLDRRRFSLSLCLLQHRIKYCLPDDVAVFDLKHQSGLRVFATSGRLRDVVNEQRPDVILSNLDATGPYVGEALADARHQPAWIARTSNSPEQAFRGARGLLRMIRLKRVYPRADFFVANSTGLAGSFAKVFPFAAPSLRTIGNPVDVENLHRLSLQPPAHTADPAIPTLFWMGRLYPQKRLDVLIDTFHRIVKVRSARLWICGKGPCESDIRKQIDRLELTDSVRLFPFQDNPFSLLAEASLAFSTSDFEGLSNSVLEAQALGIPVVATRCDFGNEEIVDDGHTGILAERGDSAALAQGALDILASRDRHRAMSAAASARIRDRYDVSRTIPEWEDLVCKAAGVTTGSHEFSARAA